MKLIFAIAASVAAVVAVPAQAAIMLTVAPANGLNLNNIRVGQSVTLNYSLSGLPGERITGGGAVNGFFSGALGNAALRIAPSIFDDASTNPLAFFLDFTALAVGPAVVNTSLADVGSTTGLLNISAPTVSFNVLAAVPEPASWAMMIGGFGLVGGALRLRKARVRTGVSFA